jgi:tyrosinase
MNVEIRVETTDAAGRTFLTWSPVKASARLIDAGGSAGPVAITLRNGGVAGGGRVVFDTVRSDDDKETLALSLPANGAAVEFWVAGEFQHPSLAYGDAVIEAVAGTNVVGKRPLMVRIRKDATKLTAVERDRFLLALAKLNDAGRGVFQAFRDTHVEESLDEAHGYPGFGPWHRTYLLDLERTLQGVDDQVTLPYWRFDRPAPALFAPAFLGMPPADTADGDVIQFPHGHPLEFWKTDVSDPIERRPRYAISGPPPTSVQTQQGPIPWVITQAAVMNLGTTYARFRRFEGAPHGNAHVSFRGPIADVTVAAKDPLFFLLHCNIDRLWAFWQWLKKRRDPTQASTYSLSGDTRQPNDLGHKLNDTMWPWNGVRGDGTAANPRPQFAPPRPSFPHSALYQAPSASPRVREMIDYQGIGGGPQLGYDYDDVPFELH